MVLRWAASAFLITEKNVKGGVKLDHRGGGKLDQMSV
jgi:hypothetical protein